MKKFNLIRTSSLILASYFIIGFSACSNTKKTPNAVLKYHTEVTIDQIIKDYLELDKYLEKSQKLKQVLDEFCKAYKHEKIYKFSLPTTYNSYSLFILKGSELIEIGCISKEGTKINIEYLIVEENSKIKEIYVFDFDLSKNLKKINRETTYFDYQSNYGYKVTEENDKKIFSFCCNENNSIFEISLVKNDKYILIFSYDLLNNVEVEITFDEYKVLYDSLIGKHKLNDLSTFVKDNEKLLFDILKRGENNTIYFEYDSIYEILNDLTSNGRIRVK